MDAQNNLDERITASDLYAVSTLSVDVPARAGIATLGDETDDISALLAQITHDELGTLSQDAFMRQLGPDSPGLKLWDLLRRNGSYDARWGVGPTTASKIMARKRPHLFPIFDSVVKRVIKQNRTDNEWQLWWEALTEDDYLENRAESLRQDIGRPELSTLRVLDVLLWYSGTYGIHAD